MALRVANIDAPEIGRGIAAPPDRFSFRQAALAAIAFICVALSSAGVPLDTDIVAAFGCAALLIFGLPHGSFDLALLRQAGHVGLARGFALLLLYLACAAAMYTVWTFAPVAALGAFLGIACLHFAEDWTETVPPFFAIGIAAAILTGPALAHHNALATIFVRLTASPSATVLADIGTLLAPIAFIAAFLGLFIMAGAGRHARACEAGVVLGAMVVLPPLIGFALFFCLSHSPVQFAAASAELGGATRRAHLGEAGLLTLAGFGIAGGIYLAWGGNSLADGAVRASFITLSILTVPHMLVPLLLQAGSRRAAAFCRTRDSSSIE